MRHQGLHDHAQFVPDWDTKGMSCLHKVTLSVLSSANPVALGYSGCWKPVGITTLTVRLHGVEAGLMRHFTKAGVRIQLNCVPWLICSLRANAEGAVSPTVSQEEREVWDDRTTRCCPRSFPQWQSARSPGRVSGHRYGLRTDVASSSHGRRSVSADIPRGRL